MKKPLLRITQGSILSIFLIYNFESTQSYGQEAPDIPQKVQIGGRLFSDFYVPTSNFLNSNLQQVSSSLWLQADPSLGDCSSAHFTFTANQIQVSNAMGYSNADPLRTD